MSYSEETIEHSLLYALAYHCREAFLGTDFQPDQDKPFTIAAWRAIKMAEILFALGDINDQRTTVPGDQEWPDTDLPRTGGGEKAT